MDKKMIVSVAIVIVAVAVAAVLLMQFANKATGDNGGKSDVVPPMNGSRGLPNPASVYCGQQGGTLVNIDTPAGQAGYCKFGNVSCDEWALFRSNGTNCTSPEGVTTSYIKRAPCVINFLCIRGTTAFSDAYGCGCEPDNTTDSGNSSGDTGSLGDGTGMANPASVYCEDQGGTLEIVDTPEGQVGMCHFADQTCEEWALFRSNATNCTDADGTPAKTYCKPEQRGAEICTMEYRPVCGWSAECESPPCTLQTYPNPCAACIPEEVAYWTEGECPT